MANVSRDVQSFYEDSAVLDDREISFVAADYSGCRVPALMRNKATNYIPMLGIVQTKYGLTIGIIETLGSARETVDSVA
jgi:hypothetical protein